MMNRKLAQGRHVEWLRASAYFKETDLGERTNVQLKRSGKLVHRILQDMPEGRDSSDVSPWPTSGS
ncbi:hypothetical protein J2Y66_003674 [Paenarthrobacter nitroguajacolicus]|uniref:hypothetical protein n=1 Tax=Paenarthrobacter nitroguajacolicus TaxID=211146 RepID=UPI00285A6B04|nr:hypothetical protein [Paenarthrobacter nitroguajacolicus]MDR6989159.1 hypothetical protein [Paenarthrobacter nitroguajacolicus]